MTTILQLLPYFLAAVIAATAVLHHCFDDTLIQRVGLSGISIGASLKALAIAQQSPGGMQSCTILAWGVVIYGIGTYIKLRRYQK